MEENSKILANIIQDNGILIPVDALKSYYEGVLKIAGFGLGGMLIMAGKKAGGSLAKLFEDKLGRELTIEEAKLLIPKLFEFTKTGNITNLSVDDNQLKIEMKDSFLAKGLNNKKPVCKPISGFIMGFFNGITGKTVNVKETHCIAQGNSECLFEGKIT